MSNPSQYGLLVAIEGIDGSGKTTVARLAKKILEGKGLNVLLTKEPGQTVLGEKIRSILQQEKKIICDKSEFLLFAANRAQHFKELIIPELQKGTIIISDRLSDSSLAYQGYGRDLDIDIIKTVNKWCMENIEPDIIIYIDIDEATAMERIYKRKEDLTDFEREKTIFWKKVKLGFKEIFSNRKNVFILDGKLPEESLAQKAVAIIENAKN